MNEAIKKVIKAGKKVLALSGLPYWARYEGEETWGTTDGKTLKFINL